MIHKSGTPTIADPAKPRLTTFAMIASIAGEGQRTKPAPLGHALVELAELASKCRHVA
ncbi:hypothetical protein NKJ90_09965 [Mesorhizobium sp. M0051]|uniref:hypothetical protein n=1 Tax=Mesorhizobium sp. M0051 TaxID=2956862 RepID=UPI003336E049